MSGGGGFLPSEGSSRPSLPKRPPTAIPSAQLVPLSERAQSALIRHFDTELDRLLGGMKARLVSSPFRDLNYALESATKLLNLLLAIPPFDAGASIRTAYLLRLTGDLTSCLTQYDLVSSAEAKASTFALYDVLDRGWLCCLKAQIWDRALGRGISAVEVASIEGHQVPPVGHVTMTERSRLLSLALRCKESLAAQTDSRPGLDSEVDDFSGPDSDDDDMVTQDGRGITQAGSVVGATSLALGGLFGRTLAFLDSPNGGGISAD